MPDTNQYISPDQLCVGLYVQLDLNWWEHSFAFSSFKVKDESQLKQLRALALPSNVLDPAPPAPAPQEQARQIRVKQLSVLRTRRTA